MTDEELIKDWLSKNTPTRCPDGLALFCEFLSAPVDAPAAVVHRSKHHMKSQRGRKPSVQTLKSLEEAELAEIMQY